MEFIDLHVHSSASDGTLAPGLVTELALEKGLYAYALTDHDTTDGIDEAVSCRRNRTGGDSRHRAFMYI